MTVMAGGETRRRGATSAELAAVDRWWRAANYLAVGQIYLLDNPLLSDPLQPEHIKPRLLGHWGTTPGLTFLWAHLNRVIAARDLDALFVTGPGHGGPAVVATSWLEQTYSERFPDVSRDGPGMGRLFRQFSFPGGIPSHAAPETPGSLHEGGELGYSLAHAYGAAMDNPGLLVACVIGDGEAEAGALAASWHANKFLDPVSDGTVLPILHLNGYKIANPTVLARIPERELRALLEGYGHVLLRHHRRPDRRSDAGARADGRGARSGVRPDQRHPGRRRGRLTGRATALAGAGAAQPQGLDRAGSRGRGANRGNLARPPGAAGRCPGGSPASGPAGVVAALLPPGGAVRRAGATAPRAGRLPPPAGPADEREPPRQRW